MRPRARLISLIGEELISDEPVALVELVKNAYDADASHVSVRFEGSDPQAPEVIVVEDDGTGMSLETVLTSWFEPGTTHKTRQRLSEGGRIQQGAKGIGRFAAARLGDTLVLETRRADQKAGVFVEIDWGAFNAQSFLDEIKIKYATKSIRSLRHGTRLTISGLRRPWDEEAYRDLYTRLSRLISPFDDVSDFVVELTVPGFPQLSGQVEPPPLTLDPKYILEGNVDVAGRLSGELRIDGETVALFKKEPLGDGDERPTCGPFRVEIRAWDRDRPGLLPFAEHFETTVSELRKTLDAFSGVSIYRDGFRVYPYGQKGNDWLNLDLRSRLKPGARLANNQLIAAIRVTRDRNPELRDRSTREGLIVNPAYHSLEEWFKLVLSKLEEARYELRPGRTGGGTERGDSMFAAFDLKETTQQVRRELGARHPVAKLIDAKRHEIDAGVERVQEAFSRLITSAGLGQMVDIVVHEIGAPLGKIGLRIAGMEQRVLALTQVQERPALLGDITAIREWLQQLTSLRERLDPQTTAKRGRAVTFSVGDEIADTFALYDSVLRKQRIQWDVQLPDDALVVTMPRNAVSQVLVNILDNSIYWLMKRFGPGKGGQIEVTVERLPHGFTIRMEDNGPGVAPGDIPRIFDPYFTRKANGMGLGLYIATQVIQPYGSLQYCDDGDLGGACFDASYTQKVGL